MTLVQGCSRHRWKHSSVAFLNSSSPPKSELSNQLVRPSKEKLFIAVVLPTAPAVPKYIEKDLQQFFKIVLETQTFAPVSAPAPTFATSKKFRNKLLKACSPNVYSGKFHIDFYNFSQQYENYFVTIRATKPNQIIFAIFSL